MADAHGCRVVWTPLTSEDSTGQTQAIGLACGRRLHKLTQLSLQVGRRSLACRAGDLESVNQLHGPGPTYLWPIPRLSKPTRVLLSWSGGRQPAGQCEASIPPVRGIDICVSPVAEELPDVEDGAEFYMLPPDVLFRGLRGQVRRQDSLRQAAAEGRLGVTANRWGLRSQLLDQATLTREAGRGRALASSVLLDDPRVALFAPPAMCDTGMAMALADQGVKLIVQMDSALARGTQARGLWWKLPDDRRVLYWAMGRQAGYLPETPCRFWLAVPNVTYWFDESTLPAPKWQLSSGMGYVLLDDFARMLAADSAGLEEVEAVCPEPPMCDLARRPASTTAVRRSLERLSVLETALATAGSAELGTRVLADVARDRAADYCVEPTRAASDAVSAAVEVLGRRLSGEPGQSPAATVTIYNSLSWPRRGLVCLADRDLPTGPLELFDRRTGERIPCLRRGRNVEFLAPFIPACGWASLEVRTGGELHPGPRAAWDGRQQTLHWEGYVLQFHEAGGLARWHDRDHSMQWCSPEVERPLGSVWLQRETGVGGQETGDRSQEGGKAKITPSIGPFRTSVAVESEGVRTEFALYRGSPDLHVRVEVAAELISGGGDGWAYFPFGGEEPFLLLERAGHQIRPAEDLIGLPSGDLAISRGVRVEQPHAGVNFYPLDTPLVRLGTPGESAKSVVSGVLAARLWSGPVEAEELARRRKLSWEFVARPTGNDTWDGRLTMGGAEVFQPLLAVPGSPAGQGVEGSLLRVDPPSVQLVGLRPADEGGLDARIWNADVERVRATIHGPGQGASGRRYTLPPNGSITVRLQEGSGSPGTAPKRRSRRA